MTYLILVIIVNVFRYVKVLWLFYFKEYFSLKDTLHDVQRKGHDVCYFLQNNWVQSMS